MKNKTQKRKHMEIYTYSYIQKIIYLALYTYKLYKRSKILKKSQPTKHNKGNYHNFININYKKT